MRALSLFVVCVLAKVSVLAERIIPFSAWTPFAYLWQDALVALLFAGFEFSTRKHPRFATGLYVFALFYIALNVPLTRALSSPLTWPMSQAAGGALADSITHYLTWTNFGLVTLLVAVGAMLPRLFQRLKPRSPRTILAGGAMLVALGPYASAKVDCAGLQRNPFIAFASSALPQVHLPHDGWAHDQTDWRASPLSPFSPAYSPAVSGASAARSGLAEFRGAARGRNVVMIALESTGAQYLRPYGALEDPMPNLTQLAATSVLFENVYSVCPESIRGLFSVLCSRYPAFDTDATVYERVRTPGLAQLLRDAGYRTALFHSGRFMYLGMESVIQRRGFHLLEDAGAIGGNFNSSFGVDEPATIKRALAWLDSLPPEQPFFLTYLPIAGHHPYETPEPGPFPGDNEMSQYRNALHYADSSIGELWRGLQKRGLADRTLLIVYGDHGEAFGQHDGNYGHTQFLYEENVRVPCLLTAPGLLRDPWRASQMASLLDVAPTVLDLLGLPIPSDYQGHSLLEPKDQMALFYTDYSLPLVGLRDGSWKFIQELGSSHSKLFELTQDPKERWNLAAAHPQRVRAYRERLQRWSQVQKGLLSSEFRASGRAREGNDVADVADAGQEHE